MIFYTNVSWYTKKLYSIETYTYLKEIEYCKQVNCVTVFERIKFTFRASSFVAQRKIQLFVWGSAVLTYTRFLAIFQFCSLNNAFLPSALKTKLQFSGMSILAKERSRKLAEGPRLFRVSDSIATIFCILKPAILLSINFFLALATALH